MDPRLVWCLALVSIVHSVHSDDSEWSGNDIGRSLAETPAGRYAGEGIEHGRRGDDGRDKTGDEENEADNALRESKYMKQISNEPAMANTPYAHTLKNKINTQGKNPSVKNNKSKYDENGMPRSFEDMKKKKPKQQLKGNEQKLDNRIKNSKKLTLNREYEAENLIDDKDDEWEIKRWKKNQWLENLIPKSNKFLYNNKKYHDKHVDHANKLKDVKFRDEDSVIQHNRLRRDVLSSIYVQMPHGEEDEADSELLMDNEESRDKKSKGSTTVCLEIKSDPTKPPSTICGPEIKPSSPLDHHLYDISSNQNYGSNSFYYTEPQPDKTLWSLNPLQDPNYYSSLNYKYQSTNRENQQQNQHSHKHNGEKHKSQVTTHDKTTYQSNHPMTHNTLSSEDTTKTLKPMPAEMNTIHQDNDIRNGRGQTARNILSGNIEDSENPLGVQRNNFKDMDLNLDAAMSSNMNSYVNPDQLQYNHNGETRQVNAEYGNGFVPEQTIFYPFVNYDANGGISRNAEQLVQDSQMEMTNELPLALHSGNMQQKSSEANKLVEAQKFAEIETNEIPNEEFSDETKWREISGNMDQNIMTAESRDAYEYYPDRYPYRPTTYPYIPSRPYPYQPHRPYLYTGPYDRYDPDCRSGRCRAAEMSDGRNSEGSIVLGMSPGMPWVQQEGRNSESFWSNLFHPFQERPGNLEENSNHFALPISQEDQFRGNAYYSGRPYPYRPSYEYQGTYSYPYTSRPYPYRPYSSSYPYDSNCRTADGRSCRDAEAERSANADANVSPSVQMTNYIHPHFPVSQPILPKGSKCEQANQDNYRSMSLNMESNPADSSSSFESQPRSAEISAQEIASSAPENELLGLSPLARTSIPVASNIHTHAPLGLACNVVHAPIAPVVPVQPLVPFGLVHGVGTGLVSGIGTHGVGLGGHGHLGGGISTGLGTHGVVAGLATHGLGHGISLNTQSALTGLGTHGFHGLSGGLNVNHGSVMSGVGTHGLGGSHGVLQHHLLGEKRNSDAEQEEALEDKEETNERNSQSESKSAETKLKAAARVEELKTKVEEKLRAAQEKLESSKSAILEKINKNIEKERKIQDSKASGNKDEQLVVDSESGSTFTSPAIVQFPTGGKITYHSGFANLPMVLGSSLLTAAPSGSSAINLKTPLGGSITYDSPFLGYGAGVSTGGYHSYYPSSYRSVDVSQCNCQPGALTCACAVNPGSYSMSRNVNAYIESRPAQLETVPASPMIQTPYVSLNAPIVGASPMEQSVMNTPLSESSVSFESEQKSANIPCASGNANQILGSSIGNNVQLPTQAILSPQQSPVGITLQAPLLGSVQYQHELSGYPDARQSQVSPMVGFASLSEMKERENQLKQNYPSYDHFNQLAQDDRPTFQPYENLYRASVEQKPCDTTNTFRNTEDSLEIKTSDVKVAKPKRPDLKELQKLPSKIITSKPPRPIPILKLPKPNLKSAGLRASQKEPCT
ncbi:hypothetical protein M8J76_007041 [Diaphorina citri]|nr:hypothetical protein M8J75_011961 [Diaphorina citri]KAI5716473.1 hypothetical protein M8J76_007041 [Diaphorina citri]